MNHNDTLESLAVRRAAILSKRHSNRLLKMQGLERRSYADLWEEMDFIEQIEGQTWVQVDVQHVLSEWNLPQRRTCVFVNSKHKQRAIRQGGYFTSCGGVW